MAPDQSTALAVWHGTTEELHRLTAAVQQNCSCVAGAFRSQVDACGPHRMLVDQRLLDHLLLVARTVDAFIQAEHRNDVETADVGPDDTDAPELSATGADNG